MIKSPNPANQLVKQSPADLVPQDNLPILKGPELLTDPPSDLTDEEKQNLDQIIQQATILRELSGGLCLAKILKEDFGSKVGITGFQYYRDQLFRDAGNPDDPIERMLIEQLAFAHHNLARLYIQATSATTPKQTEIYYAAAARLLSEFRRLALAFRDYRTPLIRQPQTVVRQQNVAAGDQQIAYIDNPTDTSTAEKRPAHIEVDNNAKETITNEPPATEFMSRSEYDADREAEAAETRSENARSHRKTAAICI